MGKGKEGMSDVDDREQHCKMPSPVKGTAIAITDSRQPLMPVLSLQNRPVNSPAGMKEGLGGIQPSLMNC